MEYGLDIGPGALRAAADAADGPAIESVPPVVVPADEEALESASDAIVESLLVERDDTTYAVGSAANAVADATDEPPESLFSNGVLAVDGYVEPALEALVDAVIDGEDAAIDRLCYTTPGTLVDAAEPTDAHRDTVESVFADRDVDATPISRGFAVVYDQLAGDNYTGLGICIGTQTTSVALAYYGVPALAFSLAKGSDWVVQRAAGDTGHEPAQVASVLEGFALDPDAATGGIESALARAHDALIGEILDALETEAGENDVQQGLAVPIAVAGSGAVAGLEYLLGGRFDAAPLPFSVRGVRLADDPEASAARGALAAAEDDVEAYEDVTWSSADANDGGSEGAPPAADAIETSPANGRTTLSFDDAIGGDDPDHDRADDAIDQLFDRLANRDEEIQSVRADLESAFEELDYVEERAAEAEVVADLDERLEAFADDLRDLEAESETHASEEAVDELETDLDAELEELSGAFAALEDTVVTLESELADDIDGLESGLADDIDTLGTDLAADIETLESSLETLEETTADDRDALDDRMDDLDGDLESVVDRTETLEERRTDLETLESELKTLDEETASATDLEAVTETVSDHGKALERVDEEIDRLETRAKGLAGRLEEQSVEIGGVSDRLEEHAERADDERDRLEEDIDAVETDLEAVADDLTDVRRSVRDRVDDLEGGLESAREAIEHLETTTADDERVDAVETELAALETELVELGDSITAVSETVADLEDRAAFEATVDDLAADLENVEGDVSDLAGEIDAFEETLETRLDGAETELTDRVDSVEDHLDDAVTDLRSKIETETDRLETRLDDVDETVGDLDEHGATIDDASAIEGDVAALEGAIESLEADVASLRHESGDRHGSLERIDDLADGIDEVGERIDGIAARTDLIDDRTSEHGNRLAERATELEAHDARLDSLAAEIDELEPGVEASTASDGDETLDSLRADLDELRSRQRVREQSGAQSDSSETRGIAGPIAAGGGGAGVVAGGTLVLAGDGTVGAAAVVIGLVLLGLAVALAR